LNYISPEALIDIAPNGSAGSANPCFKLSRSADIWSLGCILYQMAYGEPPFAKVRSLVAKLHTITDQNHVIQFPDFPDKRLLVVLKQCLQRNPEARATIPDLLKESWQFNDSHQVVQK